MSRCRGLAWAPMRFGAALRPPIGFGGRPFGESVARPGLALTARASRRFASDHARPTIYKRPSSLAVLSTPLLDRRPSSPRPCAIPQTGHVTRHGQDRASPSPPSRFRETLPTRPDSDLRNAEFGSVFLPIRTVRRSIGLSFSRAPA